MLKFTSNFIKTDVTSVKIHNKHIFSGIGGFVHIHDIKSLILLHKEQIFDGIKIYGIHINESNSKILFHGENNIKIYNFNSDKLELNETILYDCSDWILSAKWIENDSNIVTISMHNIVEQWTNKMKLIKKVICEECCILYCAFISYDTWENLVIFSGTVFSEVLIWKPAKFLGDDFCLVLKRLKGHQGVLFSIHHNPTTNLIASTSDDRSVILWSIKNDLNVEINRPMDEIDIKLKHIMYGHTARVFGCKILTNHVISIGEDGILNIWDFNGVLSRKLDTHQGGCVWVLDCDERNNVLITGGGDSGITKFHLNPDIILKSICLDDKEVPKKVGLLQDNDVVVITESGRIFYYHKLVDKWIFIAMHVELKSYALLEVSKCRNVIAFAGFNGHIFIYKRENHQIKLIVFYQTKMRSRIFSLHWITCNIFLTSGLNGLLYLWAIQNKCLVLFHVMELPASKERWSTAACFCDNRFVIGDRKGNIHLFGLNEFKPLSSVKKAHNYLGITNLYYLNEQVVSLGRNSTIKKFKFNTTKSILIPTTSDKLQFTWLATLSKIQSTNTLLAFSGKDLILFDYDTRRILLEKNCGGGHRSWDFNSNLNNISFAYIKDKFINIIDTNDTLYPHDVLSGYNVNEINNLKALKLSHNVEKILLISGGEDTTLRLSNYDFKSNTFKNNNILKSHLSSIRCLTLSKQNDTEYFLFSAGGRAQIILWEVILDNEIICNELFSFYEEIDKEESEIRIMDLYALKKGGKTLLFAACSDGKIKIYYVSDGKLCFLNFLQYELRCIIKITALHVFGSFILVSMATDGFAAFWDLTEFLDNFCKTNLNRSELQQIAYFASNKEYVKNLDSENDKSSPESTNLNKIQPFHKIKMNQSGINSFSHKKISQSAFIFITGGDDNALTINYFKFIQKNNYLSIETIDDYTNVETHCAQITGVCITDKYFLSASLDQKLVIFNWYLENDRIFCNYCNSYDTAISDIKGFEVFEEPECFKVVLYGLGVEILTINGKTSECS